MFAKPSPHLPQLPRPVWLAALLVLLLLGTGNTRADTLYCSGNAVTETVRLPDTVRLPRDHNLANGALLTSWVYSPATTNYFTCRFNSSLNLSSGTAFTPVLPVTSSRPSVSVPNLRQDYDVYDTDVPGIGLAIAYTVHVNRCGWLNSARQVCNGNSPQYNGAQIAIALVKTGPFTSGTITPRVYVQASPFSATTRANSDATWTGSISYKISDVTIKAGTCTPSLNNERPIPLGEVPIYTFTKVGSTSKPADFTLGLDCTGVKSEVFATFTDVRNPGNRSDTLPLTSDSDATGVGVQILFKGNALRLGPDSSAAGAANQIRLFSADGNTPTFNVPMQARYIQTASRVTPGSANSTATVTFSYQ